jgi:hypothetical protein
VILYQIFDLCVASELPLPGLPGCTDKPPDWSIVMPVSEISGQGFEIFHSWKAPDGQDLMACARCGKDYLLDIIGLARFRIDFGGRHIQAQPLTGCTDNTLAHLLLDQVLPRVVCHGGRMVMHASAVLLEDGRAVAFSAPSGRGKSTLALAFHQAGHRVIADDCLLLQRAHDSVSVISAYPSLRLWPDSLAALTGGREVRGSRVSQVAHYTNKKQLGLAPDGAPGRSQCEELSALFLLDGQRQTEQDGRVVIESAGGNTAIMAMIESLFALDVVAKDVVRRNFAMSGQLAGSVPVFHLRYPREYGFLPEVLDQVVQIGS